MTHLIGQPSTPEAHQSADEAMAALCPSRVRCAAEASVTPTASTYSGKDKIWIRFYPRTVSYGRRFGVTF